MVRVQKMMGKSRDILDGLMGKSKQYEHVEGTI